MKKNGKGGKSLFSPANYVVFFLLVSFVVTCCFLLFLRSIDLTKDMVQGAARATFLNVLFLSLLFAVIDGVRRKITVERPVKKILNATHLMAQGDFTARIAPAHSFASTNEFDIIGENFNKMAQELSNVETLRSDFIANVSHELKTPLSIIQNYATMLQDPTLPDDEQVEHAKTIALAAGVALSLMAF